MTNTDRASQRAEKLDGSAATYIGKTLTSALGAVLGLATLMGFCLHLSGDVAYSTYLDGLGIQASLFPQAVDAKIIFGYYVTVVQGIGVLNDVPWRIVVPLYVFCTVIIVILRAPATKNPRLSAVLRRLPGLVRECISVGAVTALSMSVLASICCLLLLVAIVPGLAAERYGKRLANEKLRKLASGDQSGVSELWKDETQLARGQIVAANSDLIAIYDQESNVIRTLPALGVEIRTPVRSQMQTRRSHK